MDVSCSTEVWVATARLHQEHPDRAGFRMQEIINKTEQLRLYPSVRPGVIVNLTQQCVANKTPNPATHRMLTAIDGNQRRLFRSDDDFHPLRASGKIRPDVEEIPDEHRDLVAWYDEQFNVVTDHA